MKILAFIVTLLISLPLWAQSLAKLDSDQPIEIAADSLEVLQDKHMAIFSGSVEAVQGNITLKAQRMKVYYREVGKQSAAANLGAVSRIEVERDVMLTMPEESARSSKGIYNVDKQMVTLVGGVVLARGKNMLRGGRLDYNLKTQKSLLTSGGAAATKEGGTKPSGGRVKGVFIPGQ